METPRSVCGCVFTLLFLLPALSLGASTKPIPEQMKYVGISYDIIKGNPEGNQKTGGVDPGLLTTRRVLKLTYDNGKVTADNEYRVPDEVDFVRRSSSYTSQEKDTFHGTKSYAKKLSHQVNVDGKLLVSQPHAISRNTRFTCMLRHFDRAIICVNQAFNQAGKAAFKVANAVLR